MATNYEIRGALSVRADFKHIHAQQFAESIANPADVYFATDPVTHSLVLRIRGALHQSEQQSVEESLEQFARKWAMAGAIFSRLRYGEPSFVPLGLSHHVDLLAELDDLHAQLNATLERQAFILKRFLAPDR
ncbi:hypothetical protein M0D69_39020 [Caballeronia sp. SEWSISQ10-4 2]|uniref:hypothetical protein n=1 Tax=Caballeronia sp. SEWSISQ10-4 2 TaxID=2937438 RepID=UPI00264ACE4B|nr:hypothetical protein [Caballeronia sp. SEWSISQ10-4 2]MDN7183905.1 hypothetical protein [Caballeronia sp. SEWSISQ10-4 2]